MIGRIETEATFAEIMAGHFLKLKKGLEQYIEKVLWTWSKINTKKIRKLHPGTSK